MKLTSLLMYACLLSAGTCRHHNSDIATHAEVLPEQRYGPQQRNRMDVFLPLHRDSSTANIMLIHGGAWVIGDKSGWPTEVINGLLKKGYAVSCIDYRYACGDFHRQMEDVQMAVRYVHDHSSQWKTDPDRIGLVGVSAGGHLALLYAHAYDSTRYVKAVVSLAGPTDLSDGLLYQYLQHYGIGFVVKRFLGASQKKDPAAYTDASPILHCSDVPSLFMNGQKDDLVPAVQAFRMHDTLVAHGVPADTITFANTGHNIYGPGNINESHIITEIGRWMSTCLR